MTFGNAIIAWGFGRGWFLYQYLIALISITLFGGAPYLPFALQHPPLYFIPTLLLNMTIIDLQDGTKLEMFESIFEMPTNIYAEFRANELLAAGISNIDAALNRTMSAIADNDNEKALIEAQNTYIAFKHVEAKHNPEQVQFGWLIHKINSDSVSSVTNEDRQRVVADLGNNGLTHQQVLDYLETVKKNLNLN